MAVPDAVFIALAKAQKGVEIASVKGVQTFSYEGQAFAILYSKGAAALKLGAPQHAALMKFCSTAVTPEPQDGWSHVNLSEIELALFADYIGAAYRGVAPKLRLSL